jgi:hypothetical protein
VKTSAIALDRDSRLMEGRPQIVTKFVPNLGQILESLV